MIQVQDLLYTYRGTEEPAIRGIHFDVEPGEIFGFLGPSGAGKSTTQRILIGLLTGYQGTVNVFDTSLRGWGNNYYERIGVSFELPNHYQKLTALENLQLFRSLYARESLDPVSLLEQVGLAADAQTRVSQFSKGMQMRLNFVRALLHKPDLLFLDEPTAGLDPANARTVKNLILEQKAQGCTIFLTTHNMTDADELCDRIAFIVDGQIKLIDSPRALKLRHSQRTVKIEYRSLDETTDPNVNSRQKEFALEGLGRNELFLALIRDQEVETIHTQEATLEDIFIQVTGRSLS